MFKNRGQAPSDLPRRYWWARDELVRRRLRNSELEMENIRLRLALARASGDSPSEVLADALANLFEEMRPTDG